MKQVFLCALLAFSGFSYAAPTTLGPVVPTNWRIENYVPGTVVIWYSGSNCGAGQQLSLPSSATAIDHSRLLATIAAAKAGSLKIFVIYDNAIAGCPITSFGIQ